MDRTHVILMSLLIAGCSVGSAAPACYTGAAPACGRNDGGGTTATLTRLARSFSFAPYDGSLIVDGEIAADGTLGGTLVLRPAQASPSASSHVPPAQSVLVSGQIATDSAIVTYMAPGCSAQVRLARVRPPVF